LIAKEHDVSRCTGVRHQLFPFKLRIGLFLPPELHFG
jgi:hypothetical protein